MNVVIQFGGFGPLFHYCTLMGTYSDTKVWDIQKHYLIELKLNLIDMNATNIGFCAWCGQPFCMECSVIDEFCSDDCSLRAREDEEFATKEIKQRKSKMWDGCS